ncbi:hypothetical protein IAT38_006406 [Cryptococcus sp. DSM 104549]
MLALTIFLAVASMISPVLGQTVTELVTTTSTATSTVPQTTATTTIQDSTDDHTGLKKLGMPLPAVIVLCLGAVLTLFGIPLVMFASRFVRARAQRKAELKKKMSGSSLASSDTSSSNVDLEKGVVSVQHTPELASSSASTSDSASASPSSTSNATSTLPADAITVRLRYNFRAEARVEQGELPADLGQIVLVLQWEGVEAEDGTNQWFIAKDMVTGETGLIPKAFVTTVTQL